MVSSNPQPTSSGAPADGESSVMHTYARLPVTFSHGEGAWLWDTQGRRYMDALSGIAVCGLGHAHPRVTEALADQAGKLIHTSNLYGIALQESLGNTLCESAGMDAVFFANSGAEANEAAIKIVRKHGHARAIETPVTVVMEGSFHGRTLATLSATGNPKVQAGFEPLVSGFVHVPYGDADAVRDVVASNPDVVAVLVEPIQGEGGVNVPPSGYLSALRDLCDENDLLFMLDEIQTGMGRTGRLFGWQHENAQPDVMTLAKALGNGVPIGACLARGIAATTLVPGNHGSTFGGNPLACRAGLTVLRVLDDDRLVQRSLELGDTLRRRFREALQDNNQVVDIRGMGLMIGIELDHPCAHLVGKALEAGLLINVTSDTVIRLLPPLILSDEQGAQLVESVVELINAET